MSNTHQTLFNQTILETFNYIAINDENHQGFSLFPIFRHKDKKELKFSIGYKTKEDFMNGCYTIYLKKENTEKEIEMGFFQISGCCFDMEDDNEYICLANISNVIGEIECILIDGITEKTPIIEKIKMSRRVYAFNMLKQAIALLKKTK